MHLAIGHKPGLGIWRVQAVGDRSQRTVLVVDWLVWTFCKEWGEGRTKWHFKPNQTKPNQNKTLEKPITEGLWFLQPILRKSPPCQPSHLANSDVFAQEYFFERQVLYCWALKRVTAAQGRSPGCSNQPLVAFPSLLRELWWLQGCFHLHLWVSEPNVQVSIWADSDTLAIPVLISLGLGLPVSIGVCVHLPITQRDQRGWRLPSTFPIPLTAFGLGLSTGAVHLRVKLLSQHACQTCSFGWNPVKVEHLNIPEAEALISQLLTFFTCKAEYNNLLYETDWDVWPKGPKPRRVNFY